MLRRLFLPLAVAVVALAGAPSALAGGGDYVFDGGTAAQRQQVVAALEASSFPWGVVPGPVTIHIARGAVTSALPGQIWLDADLLDSGRFAWGVVQHEYGHQVDFALLTDAMRAQLHLSLGGSSWWGPGAHPSLDSERFATLVAWSYWQSTDNVMRPLSAQDEGGQMTPAAFRAAVAALLPAAAVPEPVKALRSTAAVKKPAARNKR